MTDQAERLLEDMISQLGKAKALLFQLEQQIKQMKKEQTK